MSNARIKNIEAKIQYVLSNPKQFKNPGLIVDGLNNLLINLGE